jgi:ankyrin repeat protein
VNENKDSVTAIANAIIDDARGKLSPIDFLNFINYRFINPPAASYDMEKDGGYGNSALTLAIKSGLISVAQNLVDLGANVNISDAHGGFTPLHLMMIRMPLKKEILDSEVRLLRDLVLKTDPNLKDNFDYRAKDSLTLRFPVEFTDKI